jgi:hypothetical protein
MSKFQRAKFKVIKENCRSEKQKSPTKMPIIKCSCGAKILVVPDLPAMERAIKNHKTKHKSVNEQFLTEKILKATIRHILQQA